MLDVKAYCIRPSKARLLCIYFFFSGAGVDFLCFLCQCRLKSNRLRYPVGERWEQEGDQGGGSQVHASADRTIHWGRGVDKVSKCLYRETCLLSRFLLIRSFHTSRSWPDTYLILLPYIRPCITAVLWSGANPILTGSGIGSGYRLWIKTFL